MGRAPDLKEIIKMMEKGEPFELTDAKYEKLSGIPLPKGKNYLTKQSALARAARKRGFELELVEKRVIFKK